MVGYVYQPLPSDEAAIRILTIHGMKDGLINCSVRNVVVGQCDYIALSYVWGSGSPVYKILLDDRAFWIRPNLWLFLSQASTWHEKPEMWIDAICINQDSLGEKQRQIPLMSQIFSQAVKVIAWLHEPFSSSTSDSDSADLNLLGPRALAETSMNSICQADSNVDITTNALVRLLEHEYWSRLWIVQEILLAKQVELIWGPQSLPWASLQGIMFYVFGGGHRGRSDDTIGSVITRQLEARRFDIRSLSFADLLDDTFREVSLADPGQFYLNRGHRLGDLVIKFQRHSCLLLHDRVFALLALARVNIDANYSESRLCLLGRVWKACPDMTVGECENIGKMLQLEPAFGFDVEIVRGVPTPWISGQPKPSEQFHFGPIQTSTGETLEFCIECLPDMYQNGNTTMVCLPSINLFAILTADVGADSGTYFWLRAVGRLTTLSSSSRRKIHLTMLDFELWNVWRFWILNGSSRAILLGTWQEVVKFFSLAPSAGRSQVHCGTTVVSPGPEPSGI